MPLSTFVMRVEFALMGFKQRLKRPFIPRYRRARLKFLAFLVAMYALPYRFLNWCTIKGKEAQRKIDKVKARPFFVTDNPNKVPMPSDLRYETTRLALKQLGTIDALNPFEVKEPTRRMVLDAYKRAEMVRGDGKVPKPSEKKPVVRTKARTEAEIKLDETVKSIEEQSEKLAKAVFTGLAGGIANAGRDINMNDEPEVDDVDSVREDSGRDS